MLNQRSNFLSNMAVLGVICSGVGFGAVSSSFAADVASESSQSQVPFTFGTLVAKMKAQAQEAYTEPTVELPGALAELEYDGYRKIGYNRDRSKWNDTENFRVHAFHPGWLFKHPLKIYEVSEGAAQPFVFEAADFDYHDTELSASLSDVSFPGVAGFRLLNPLNVEEQMDELVAFLGASYFRALGAGNTYGLSARALAIDTASSRPEEFPHFTAFYLGKPVDGANLVTVWAELDSPSVTGAYQFTFKPGQQTEVDVTAHLFFRSDVERLGIAPLTSMYLYGENDRTGFDDFRPEVHDSDGLKLRFANGNTSWRPLTNPNNLQLSFLDAKSPVGFGLMQRDRDFEHYQDLEARYDKRPSLWIEPLGDWGEGSVMLAEIPTDQEINDNIVAFWTPDQEVKAGDELSFHYKMYWGDEVGHSEQVLMPVTQTRSGKAGHSASTENSLTRKFVVDFDASQFTESGLNGEQLVRAKPAIDNAALNGTVDFVDIHYIEELGIYRVFMDVSREDLSVPVELRLQLTDGEKAVSEEWLYQWGWSS
ncbi:glucans biosynthesis protein G [Pseudovibrio japonicus]|uniref:Glucans biosynthesis protein G n=1 Tax=Pseudovibrio japonicus TaxID=366534 RepID=A0ABQ3ENE1_9HYPH|nr:glucan biosynthesis protein [Pseudovibrio japonicus]GHB48190.1 glucans biosynthesis protein G [Pseudovibrio japonicus]